MFREIPNTATLENFGITFPFVGILWQTLQVCIVHVFGKILFVQKWTLTS